jgi:deoxyhypusine synthase
MDKQQMIRLLEEVSTASMLRQVGDHAYANVMFGGSQIVIGAKREESPVHCVKTTDEHINLMRQEWIDTAEELIVDLQREVHQTWELVSAGQNTATIQLKLF